MTSEIGGRGDHLSDWTQMDGLRGVEFHSRMSSGRHYDGTDGEGGRLKFGRVINIFCYTNLHHVSHRT